jgi:hypothetical protein
MSRKMRWVGDVARIVTHKEYIQDFGIKIRKETTRKTWTYMGE